jgi:hypothetical protein
MTSVAREFALNYSRHRKIRQNPVEEISEKKKPIGLLSGKSLKIRFRSLLRGILHVTWLRRPLQKTTERKGV